MSKLGKALSLPNVEADQSESAAEKPGSLGSTVAGLEAKVEKSIG